MRCSRLVDVGPVLGLEPIEVAGEGAVERVHVLLESPVLTACTLPFTLSWNVPRKCVGPMDDPGQEVRGGEPEHDGDDPEHGADRRGPAAARSSVGVDPGEREEADDRTTQAERNRGEVPDDGDPSRPRRSRAPARRGARPLAG